MPVQESRWPCRWPLPAAGRCPPGRRCPTSRCQRCSAPRPGRARGSASPTPAPWTGNSGTRPATPGPQSRARWCSESAESPEFPGSAKTGFENSFSLDTPDRRTDLNSKDKVSPVSGSFYSCTAKKLITSNHLLLWRSPLGAKGIGKVNLLIYSLVISVQFKSLCHSGYGWDMKPPGVSPGMSHKYPRISFPRHLMQNHQIQNNSWPPISSPCWWGDEFYPKENKGWDWMRSHTHGQVFQFQLSYCVVGFYIFRYQC